MNKTKKRSTKKKSDRKKLIEECDSWFSKCVVARDHTCRYSNSDERLTCHHIRSRTHFSTRWNLENGLCLSWKVHFLQKANPEKFQDMVIEIIGDEEYQRLKTMSLVEVKYTVVDIEDRIQELKQEYKRLKNE